MTHGQGTFDCGALLTQAAGHAYAHEYEGYMAFFALLGHATAPMSCEHVPASWVPFVRYLGHHVVSATPVRGESWEGEHIEWGSVYQQAHDKRRVVEMASACRPELVHALYLADTAWPCPLRQHEPCHAFVVTCIGSFFRPVVQGYHQRLRAFTPTRRKAVLTPCAAAKPYPAPLHQAVLERIDRSQWHVMVATGVLGLVPEELWAEMPHYDSGLPNLHWCETVVCWYFSQHAYDRVVVYSDFYAQAIARGLSHASQPPAVIQYCFGQHYRDTYENLLLPEHLMTLEQLVREP